MLELSGGVLMGYKVKWVEDNLGISRKALRNYEKEGLMPKNTDRQYRDYDDDDIDRIWAIRVMQGMGYTVKEIANIVEDKNFNFEESLGIKINELEDKKEKIERHLGYAKTIKFTGRFPSRPKKMGEIKFDDFQEKALEGWNIATDSQADEYQKLAETMLSKSQEEWNDTDIGRMLAFLGDLATMDTDFILYEHILPKEIVKRQHLGANNPEIQFIVKMIYENYKNILQLSEMSAVQFSRFYSASYLSGDIAKFKANGFTETECEFIAEAVAVFGGFENFEDLLEKESKYGR